MGGVVVSLYQLLPDFGVTHLMGSWPDQPKVYARDDTCRHLDVTAEELFEIVEAGCYPAAEIAAVCKPYPPITQSAWSVSGRTDAKKLSGLYGRGYTIRLGNAQRVIPALARVSAGIQRETGYSNYVHAFLTPQGKQGLSHHWDQQMAVIVQLSGVKRWQLWKPVVEAPMRDVEDSGLTWRPSWVPAWEETGPDVQVDLTPGQVLLLPRGWVHNPSVPADGGDSVHLTFAIRERTPYWLAEELLGGLLADPEMRRVILPGTLLGDGLPGELAAVREKLRAHLDGLDTKALAPVVQSSALTGLEYTT